MRETAAIIIIGNEILSGKVQDCNGPFMLEKLRHYGVDVRRVSTIPDKVEVIASEVRRFSQAFDHVFTTGGLGPTHDDVTMEAMAKAFDVEMVDCEEIKAFFLKKNEKLKPGHLKMARVPRGAEITHGRDGRHAFLRFRNIFIFPGVPECLHRKFSAVCDWIERVPIFLKKVYIAQKETDISPILDEVVKTHSKVDIGSYPISKPTKYKVMITLESQEKSQVTAAVNDLLNRLGENTIIKVESEGNRENSSRP